MAVVMTLKTKQRLLQLVVKVPMHTLAGTTRWVAESSRGYFPASKTLIKGYDNTAFRYSLAPFTVVEEKGYPPAPSPA